VAGLLRGDLFTVVHEQLMTDTAAYADIVLPATTSFEHLDLYKSYWHLYLQLGEPVIERIGSKPNIEVFRLLAERMGYSEPCFKDSTEDMIEQALNTDNPYVRGITLERIRQEKRVRLNWLTRTGAFQLHLARSSSSRSGCGRTATIHCRGTCRPRRGAIIPARCSCTESIR
jgi:anaerobic selenocysteine-containing dehydrogenase